MGVTVKLDEDLSPAVGVPLERAGHVVVTVVGQGWGGLPDPELWLRVTAEQVLFITADKGFGDLRAYPLRSHAGILLLRPDRESLVEFRALVEAVLTRHPLELLSGTLAVATPRGIRVRRPA